MQVIENTWMEHNYSVNIEDGKKFKKEWVLADLVAVAECDLEFLSHFN
jgi:hypothetical protein